MVDEPVESLVFGAELRRQRTAFGWSLDQLSRIACYSKGHLSKVERGVKAPSVALARRCDHVLDAGGRLARLVPAGHQPDTALRADQPGEVWLMELDQNGHSVLQAFDRRSILTVGAASLLCWRISPSVDPLAAAGVALPSFRKILENLRRLGHGAHPGALIPLLVSGLIVLRQLAGDTSSGQRNEVLQLAARFAEYTGWMAQENGDESSALWWTRYAVTLARSGGDPELEAYALVRQAELALYRRDSVTMIDLAEKAQRQSRDPYVTSLAAQREAQGRALDGDVVGCRLAIDRATRLAARSAADGAPLFGSASLVDPIAFATGWSLHDLGQSEASIEILGSELTRMPHYAHRMRARCAARLSLALASSHRLEEACNAIGPVLETARIVDSATVRADLRELSITLNRWRNHRDVRRIMPQLASALQVGAV